MSGDKPTGPDAWGEAEPVNKSVETRARRAAARQGLKLVKSARRDPRAYDYNRYMLVDAVSNMSVTPTFETQSALDLNQIETYLNTPPTMRDAWDNTKD